MRNRLLTVLFPIALGAGGSLWAHHSPSAIFDMKNPVTLKGTVTKVDWINPHIMVYMDAKTDDGKLESWKFESNPPKWFSQVGVARADFAEAVGQNVTIVMFKALDGSKYGYLKTIALPNGNSLSLQVAGEASEGAQGRH